MSSYLKHFALRNTNYIKLFDYSIRNNMVDYLPVLGLNTYAEEPVLSECCRVLILRLIRMVLDFFDSTLCLDTFTFNDILIDIAYDNTPKFVPRLKTVTATPAGIDRNLSAMAEVIEKVSQGVVFPADWECKIQLNRHLIDMYNKRPVQKMKKKKKGGNVAGGAGNLQPPTQTLAVGTSSQAPATIAAIAAVAPLKPTMMQAQAHQAKMPQGQGQGLVVQMPQKYVPTLKQPVSAASSSTTPYVASASSSAGPPVSAASSSTTLYVASASSSAGPAVSAASLSTTSSVASASSSFMMQAQAHQAKMPQGQGQGQVVQTPQKYAPTLKPPVSAASFSTMPYVTSASSSAGPLISAASSSTMPYVALASSSAGPAVSAASLSTTSSVTSASSSAGPAGGVHPPWPQLKLGKYNAPGSDPCDEVVRYSRNCRVHGRSMGYPRSRLRLS